jgi:DNA-binding transcriptional ArsR family regulator
MNETSNRGHPAVKLEEAARCLESLGNPTRLAVYQLLVRAGPAGLPVGQIQAELTIPGSTLSHHLAHLVREGLIEQHREGRILRCLPIYPRMTALVEFLTRECCQGLSGDC